MKNIALLLILSVISCKTTQNSTANNGSSEVILSYSKGACMGRCPVYDLEITDDGMMTFNGLKNVKPLGLRSSKLSVDQLKRLKSLIKKSTNEPQLLIKKRDLPITVLRVNKKKYMYHDSNIDAHLKEINSNIKFLVSSLNK